MDYEIKQQDKFKYIEEGSGEPLVLLHGLFGALSNFRRWWGGGSGGGVRGLPSSLSLFLFSLPFPPLLLPSPGEQGGGSPFLLYPPPPPSFPSPPWCEGAWVVGRARVEGASSPPSSYSHPFPFGRGGGLPSWVGGWGSLLPPFPPYFPRGGTGPGGVLFSLPLPPSQTGGRAEVRGGGRWGGGGGGSARPAPVGDGQAGGCGVRGGGPSPGSAGGGGGERQKGGHARR
jgi:hypothetical protein